MGKVIRLVEASALSDGPSTAVRGHGSNLVECLEHFLTLAKSGQLRGIEICADLESGSEDIAVLGSYRDYPKLGSDAAMEMALQLRLLQRQRRDDAAFA
jgi:hypothetical protein